MSEIRELKLTQEEYSPASSDRPILQDMDEESETSTYEESEKINDIVSTRLVNKNISYRSAMIEAISNRQNQRRIYYNNRNYQKLFAYLSAISRERVISSSSSRAISAPPSFEIIEDSGSSESIENLLNEERLLGFKEKYTKELLKTIAEQDFEYGFSSLADIFIRGLMKENSSVTKEWLNAVFIENFHDVKIIIGLMQIISHLEYKEIHPQGSTMALAALAHANAEVRECGIRAFENWGTIESLRVLRSVKCHEKWLQDYVDEVIADLEKQF